MEVQGSGEEAVVNSTSYHVSSGQLPPKSPSNMLDSGSGSYMGWNGFLSRGTSSGYKRHQRTPSASFLPQIQQICWLEDVLDSEGSARKNSHRRSSSDTDAFYGNREQGGKDDDSGKSLSSRQSEQSSDIDRLDEDNLMSMFSVIEPTQQQQAQQNGRTGFPGSSLECWTTEKKVPVSVNSENTSTPSDSNSFNEASYEENRPPGLDRVKSEPEVESLDESEDSQKNASQANQTNVTAEAKVNGEVDPKRAKRILANRQSAQRSRVRKLQYIAELERSVTTLQSEVSMLTPQLAFLDHQRAVLNVENNAIKQRIAGLAQEKRFKDAHNEALTKEVHGLRQLIQQQQQNHLLSGYQQDPANALQMQQNSGKLELALPREVEEKAFAADSYFGYLKMGADCSNGAAAAPAMQLNTNDPLSLSANNILSSSICMELGSVQNIDPVQRLEGTRPSPLQFMLQNS
ncbi:hypothetical protein O6H91_07G001500 [Diphasiastrum complanatum]|uniref:Uncharacterized protein n=1 Tax=Diphasiastrum complanatum TaxID=34168 RepID=A0ACC2D1P3_DIPCM|nr:hypothetical protein O6H91_07G001500 [Diphasiastrum complanatum]